MTVFRLRQRLSRGAALVALLAAGGAAANPQGGSVVEGTATILPVVDGRLEILQSSERALIDWQSFSIGTGETTRFVQPSASSVALNRVIGAEVSTILGRLEADGRVMLINPNGILFGPGASIDVAGLVATTAALAEIDPFADLYRFEGAPPGSFVINRGTITVAEGGLAALVAPWVVNEGTITARLGRVNLASGSAFTVDLFGDGLLRLEVDPALADALDPPPGTEVPLSHSGRIVADGGVVALEIADARGILDRVINMDGIVEARAVSVDGGEILLRGGLAGEVAVDGTLDATGLGDGQRGGLVLVLGDQVRLGASTRIDVSGEQLAGAITVAGGAVPEGLFAARQIGIVDGASLLARTTRSGDGGRLLGLDTPVPPTPLPFAVDIDTVAEVVLSLLPEPTPAIAIDDAVLPRAAVVTLVEEPAFAFLDPGYGLYDALDPDNRIELLAPGSAVGAQVSYQLIEDAAGARVLVDGVDAGRFGGARYGFYLDTSDFSGGGIVFSDPARNDGFHHVAGFSTAGAALSDLEITPAPLRGRTQGFRSHLQAWVEGLAGPVPLSTLVTAVADLEPASFAGAGTDLMTHVGGRGEVLVAAERIVRVPEASVLGAVLPDSVLDIEPGREDMGDTRPPDPAIAGTEQCDSWRLDHAVADADVARCYAALALESLAAHAATSFRALAAALDDPSPRSRALAARELGDIGSQLSAAVPVLVEALAAGDARVARLAESMLRDTDRLAGDVVPALARAVRDEDDEVARNATGALGALGAYATRALPDLADALERADLGVRVRAGLGIARVDAELRRTALALARLTAGAVPPELAQSLAVDRSPFRARAVGTLAVLRGEADAAAAFMIDGLAAADPAVRAEAAATLGELDRLAATSLPLLVESLALPDSGPLRAAFAEVAMPLATERLRPLLQALNDRDASVRAAAARALEALAEAALEASVGLALVPRDDLVVRRVALRAEEALAGLAPASWPALAPLTGDAPAVARPAAAALGHLGPAAAEAAPALMAALASDGAAVQREAARALGRIGAGAAVPALADRLLDPDPRVACEAARALGLLGDTARPVAPALFAAAGNDELAFCAGPALWSIDPTLAADVDAELAVARMLEAIKGPPPGPAPIEAPEALVGPAAAAALPALVRVLVAAPAGEREAAALRVTLVAEELRDEVPWLVRELGRGDGARRASAVRLLGQLAAVTVEAAPDLLAGLDHPDLLMRLVMVRALARLTAGTTAATRALLATALDDDDRAVRLSASRSLQIVAEAQQAATGGQVLLTVVPAGGAGRPLVRLDGALGR